MANIGNSNSFRYFQDARKQALERPGHERIVRTETGYAVEPLELDHTHINAPDPLGLEEKKIQDKLQVLHENATGNAKNTLEFVIDNHEDGPQRSDMRFEVRNGEVKRTDLRLGADSELLRSPESKGLDILREVMLRNKPSLMLTLNPSMVTALLESTQTTPSEHDFIQTQLNNKPFVQANQLFTHFFGDQATYQSAGVNTFEGLVERLNNPENKGNLQLLYQMGEHPERFDFEYADRPEALSSMANTFKDLPGFRRYPHQHAQGGTDRDRLKERQKTFDHALRTIDQYQYKFRLSHGMQFNRDGLSGYDTEASYRWGSNTLTLGVAGRDYNYGNPFDNNNGGQSLDQLRVAYRSPDFDLRTGVKRDDDGGIDIISPRSDWADRYIDDKLDHGKSWASEHPWKAAGVVAGAVGLAWGYSYATKSDISVDFDQRFDLYSSEKFRLRGEISPEIHINEGIPDLGLASVGLGAMGQVNEVSYNATLRHRFTDTTLGSGEINHKETDLNTRLSYRSWALETVNRWDHTGDHHVHSELGIRKNITFSDTSSGYVRPMVQLDNGKYDDAGVRAGYNKQFSRNFSTQLEAGYSEKQGETVGFRTTFQF